MAFDLWTHQFCLACDKQTDGETYCSESCRLADFEKASSTPSSSASSPGFTPPSYPWSSAPKRTTSRFYLSPAYDFSTVHLNARTAASQQSSTQRTDSSSSRPTHRSLTPSSSHSSLSSMQSSSSAAPVEAFQLSEKSKKELQAYAISFEQVRMQRRRSY